jgi:hypothetical protein
MSSTDTIDSPVQPGDRPDRSTLHDLIKSVKLWLIIAVIGLFVLALFYTLKIAADLFLPIVLGSFLGFLLTPVNQMAKEGRFSRILGASYRHTRFLDHLDLPLRGTLHIDSEV